MNKIDPPPVASNMTATTTPSPSISAFSGSPAFSCEITPPRALPLAVAAEAAVRALKEASFTLATAESCTGGLIAESITRIPGASDVFGFGWVTYANEAKQSQLGVPAAILEHCGAVSRETVEAMAEGARQRAGADLAVAVSGIAGPGGGTPDKPVGTVWIAWAARGLPVETLCLLRPMPRQVFREMVAAIVLQGVAERVEDFLT